MPRFMRYFYRAALGRTLGPWFGRMGIMSAEIESYCRNITNNPILFGVFLDQHGARGASFMNVGGMLQNLRLAARAIRTPCEPRRPTDDERLTPAAMSIPATHVIIGIALLPKVRFLEIAATTRARISGRPYWKYGTKSDTDSIDDPRPFC